jgi:predicted ABC-class ATPase
MQGTATNTKERHVHKNSRTCGKVLIGRSLDKDL